MKKNLLIALMVVAGSVFFSTLDYAGDDAGDVLKVLMDEPQLMQVTKPTRIVIGNPNIIDVTNVKEKEMTIVPKAVGTTTLAFWDSFGEQSFKVKVLAEDIDAIKQRVDNVLAKLDFEDVYTQAEEDENLVYLLGVVKTEEEKKKVDLALGALKAKTLNLIVVKEEETTIEIDAQVIELQKDASSQLGFTWPGNVNMIESASSPALQAGGTGLGSFFRVLHFNRGSLAAGGGSIALSPFQWQLSLLAQEGKARILSRPKVTCQSGKEAELLVGGEKPIFTTSVESNIGSSTSVSYKEYGIKLKIKPSVTDEGKIKISVSVDISEVGAAETIGSSDAPTALAYPLTRRTVSTELYLDDGQTLAIGGLIKQKSEEDYNRTPFLSNVPVLGMLFRKKTTAEGGGSGERGDSELFITLTPKIVDRPAARSIKKSQGELIPQPVPSAGNVPDALNGYAGAVQRRILDILAYPQAAKESGFSGTTKLSLNLSYRGELLDAKIKESSGYKILDDNALLVAKQVSSYPPFPSSIEEKDIWIDVPILYRAD